MIPGLRSSFKNISHGQDSAEAPHTQDCDQNLKKTQEFTITILGHVLGNPYRRGRISTVDLLALTSSDQLLFMLKV
jgi:hypothetical protein